MSKPTSSAAEADFATAVAASATTRPDRMSDAESSQLKRKTMRGALVSTVSQVATFALRIGSMMILARLLLKEEFGVVNMVTAFTGFLGLFRDAGLSMAAVQRENITQAQMSTLFWVNLVVGVALAGLAAVGAPLLALFYKEPRLLWVTVALGASFIFNGAGAQHRALMQRNLRFVQLTVIDVVALVISTAAGIGTALAGFGYWSLVVMTVGQPAVALVGLWTGAKWVPGAPQRGSGVRSMLHYGGTVTLNNVVVYFAYNVDKMLLGRFFGAEALGIYGRAYQLVNLPTENLNSTIGLVAFPALSRVQNDPARLREYFLHGYSLFLALVVPITMACGLFSEDIIRFFLGAKWSEAAPIFRLMAPTILIFALINPLAWMMLASGHAVRSLKIAFLIAPVVIIGYALGLKQGPLGVAAGFSSAMLLLVVPVIAWAKHGTAITGRDILKTALIPLLSVLIGGLAAFALAPWLRGVQLVFPRLVLECAVLFGGYLFGLLIVFRQKTVYAELLKEMGLWPGKRKQN